MKHYKNQIGNVCLSALLMMGLVCLQSCKKLIEVDAPYTSINSENVFTNDATASAVLTEIYASMSQDRIGGTKISLSNMVFPTGLSGDELTVYDFGSLDAYQQSLYENSLSAVANSPEYWVNIYQYVYKINAAIESLSDNTKLSSVVQRQLLGEAYFLRAYCYFHLINLYGAVPLVLTTDYKINSVMARKPVNLVYEQIINDLIGAKSLLSDDFRAANVSTPTDERLRPTKWAATALLARTYLYTKEYRKAADEASIIINKNDVFSLVGLDEVFLKNNREAIWQLQPTSFGSNSGEANLFNLTTAGPDPGLGNNFYLSDDIFMAFETGDLRKDKWTSTVKPSSGKTYPYSHKYKIGKENTSNALIEYMVVFRLAEQYLIRAEARAYLNDFDGAKGDLNAIRSRAGLNNTNVPSTTQGILDAILQERKVELFTEGGHRWFDLKRWPNNELSHVMIKVTQAKGGIWNSNWALYPIPLIELNRNPNLVQNPGY